MTATEVDTALARVAHTIAGASSVALACHVNPDGDALGSLLGLLAVLGPVVGVPAAAWLLAGFLAPFGYAAGVLVATYPMGRGLPWRARVLLPLVVVTMHLSWGAGFLRSIPRSQRRSP